MSGQTTFGQLELLIDPLLRLLVLVPRMQIVRSGSLSPSAGRNSLQVFLNGRDTG